MVNYSSASLDDTFSALGSTVRRGILARLARGTATVTELAEPYQVSLPAISKHLRVLERAGLVVRTKQGRTHTLRLAPEPLQAAADWLAFHEKFWRAQMDSLGAFLENEDLAGREDTGEWSPGRNDEPDR